MKIKHLPMVVITWEDHSSTDGWQAADAARVASIGKVVTSVGWLLHETDKVYSIVSCACDDGDVSCQQTILKAATVEVFHVPQPRRKKKSTPPHMS
jgi:hypothetical protein